MRWLTLLRILRTKIVEIFMKLFLVHFLITENIGAPFSISLSFLDYRLEWKNHCANPLKKPSSASRIFPSSVPGKLTQLSTPFVWKEKGRNEERAGKSFIVIFTRQKWLQLNIDCWWKCRKIVALCLNCCTSLWLLSLYRCFSCSLCAKRTKIDEITFRSFYFHNIFVVRSRWRTIFSSETVNKTASKWNPQSQSRLGCRSRATITEW